MKILEAMIIITLVSFIFAGHESEKTEEEQDTVVATVRATRARTDLDLHSGAEDYRMTDEVHEIASEAYEIERMHDQLLGNVWLPGGSDVARTDNRYFHSELDRLQILVDNKSATEAEITSFLEMNLTSMQDRVDMIQYYHQRMDDIRQATGVQLIPEDAIAAGEVERDQLETKISGVMAQLGY